MKFTVLLVTLLPAFVWAAPPASEPEDKFITTSCSVTARVRPEEKLPASYNVVPSGKLALPAGKSIFAPGQRIYLSGKVLDENCVPVSDAIVEIWQADSTGKYVRTTLGERLSPFPAFVSTGRAVTDNLGRYKFVTVFPGLGKEAAPHIHVRVTRKNFPPLETEMYFGGDGRNEQEARFSELSQGQRETVTAKVWPRDPNAPEGDLYARWNITLAGKNRYRHY